MFSTFKPALLVFLAVVVCGCSTANLVSTIGFDMYVPDQYYETRSCHQLRQMQREMIENPWVATLNHMGVAVYGPIPEKPWVQMVEKNQEGIRHALDNRC